VVHASAQRGVQISSVMGPKRFSYWYETIIDLLIANPELRLGEIARRVGRTQAWISLVINSDGFKQRYALRRGEHSEKISRHVEDRLHAAASLSLDKLVNALETKDINPAQLTNTTDMLLSRLGYSGKAQPPTAIAAAASPILVQVFAPVSGAVLAEAQQNIRSTEALQLAERASYSAERASSGVGALEAPQRAAPEAIEDATIIADEAPRRAAPAAP